MALRMDAETGLAKWSDIESEESDLSSDEDEESDEEGPPEQTPSEICRVERSCRFVGKKQWIIHNQLKMEL